MKVKLLNDGGYGTAMFKDVKFPVIVDGFYYEGMIHCVGVTSSELIRIGVHRADLAGNEDLAFEVSQECEVI